MPRISKSILVPYSAKQMYSLVTDVPAYPQFLPWCSEAKIIATHEDGYTATVGFNLKGVKKSFTTRNVSQPYERITMSLVSGPFRNLNGHWNFVELEDSACKVEFELDYEFSSRLLASTIGPIFKKISNSMVDAFHTRALHQYGDQRSDSN